MQKDSLSLELHFIISLLKVGLKKLDAEKIDISADIDWNRFNSLVDFHSIRPLIYHALKKINSDKVPSNVTERLRGFALGQTLLSLHIKHESDQVIDLIKNAGLRGVLYKGMLFEKEIYKNSNLRETVDIDLLAHPEDLPEIFRLLIQNGYELFGNDNKVISVSSLKTEHIPADFEVEMRKKVASRVVVIDLHVNIYPTYSPVKIPVDVFFSDQDSIYFRCMLMMIVHHGNREGWLKLKHLTDWIVFWENSPEGFEATVIREKLKQYQIEKAFDTGNKLISDIFDYKTFFSTNTGETADTSVITQFWDNPTQLFGNHTLSSKGKMEKIIWSMQDKPSLKKYLRAYYDMYSTPNLLEKTPRIITFPLKFKFLNFVSKMITVLIKGN